MKAPKSALIAVVAAMLTLPVFFAWRSFGRNVSLASSAQPSSNAPVGKKQLWHCGMHPQVIEDHPGDCPICHMALTPLLAADAATTGIEIDPRVVQNMGVTTAKVAVGPLVRTVRTVGLVSLPETGMRDVSLKVNGWIQKLYANQEGMHVEKGQPLFELYSPELLVAAQELVTASRSLRGMGDLGGKDSREQAERLVETAKRKLRLWDVSDADIDAIIKSERPPETFSFRSPLSGHIEEKMVVEGAGVQAGMKLFRLADHSTVWLNLDIFPSQIPIVEVGQKVTASIEGLPGRSFEGKVTFLYPHLDHATRTLKVRATLDNPGFELKPGMYATAELHAMATHDATLCPREAVIDTGSKQIVFVPQGGGHYVARQVTVGQFGDQDTVEILHGLKPGDEVVTSGQFLMDVESRTVEAVRKLAGADADFTQATTGPSTNPATSETRKSLTIVYCPMEKASWIQSGKDIQNPYMGQKMPDCGEPKGELSAPETGTPLSVVVESYLRVTRSMLGGTLNADDVARLKDAGEKLPRDEFKDLRAAVAAFAVSSDIKAARDALPTLSDRLKTALQATRK